MTASVGAAGRSWRPVSPSFGVTTKPPDCRRDDRASWRGRGSRTSTSPASRRRTCTSRRRRWRPSPATSAKYGAKAARKLSAAAPASGWAPVTMRITGSDRYDEHRPPGQEVRRRQQVLRLAPQRQRRAQQPRDRAEAAPRPAVLLADVGGEVLRPEPAGQHLGHVDRRPAALVEVDGEREVLGQRSGREAAGLAPERGAGTATLVPQQNIEPVGVLAAGDRPEEQRLLAPRRAGEAVACRRWRSTAASARRRRDGRRTRAASLEHVRVGTWSQSRTSTNGGVRARRGRG